jgi:hypothetical protein
MKEDPGSSTLIMLVVRAYHLYPMPLFSEAGDQETNSVGLSPPPPHQNNLGKAPSRPIQVHTPPLAKMPVVPGSVEITPEPLIRGRRP